MRSVRQIETVASRGGRRFEAIQERELYGFAGEVAESLPGPNTDALVIAEMSGPLGVPDFVVLVGGCEWLEARRDAGVPPVLSETECFVLSVLSYKRALSVQTICSRLRWGTEHVDRAVSSLLKIDAVTKTRNGAILAAPGIKPEGVVFAIEAKTSNWRKAILQGRSYRTWANNYVVLLGDVGELAADRAKAQVLDDGAGLFVHERWAVKPKTRTPVLAHRLQGFEHIFSVLLSNPAFGLHK